MKYASYLILPLLLILFLTSCGGGEKYPRSTPEELGESLLEVIKNKDKEGLRSLLPWKDDLLSTMEGLPLSDEEKEEAREGMEKNWPKVEANMENDIIAEFNPLIAEIDRRMDLATLELKEVKVSRLEVDESEFESGNIKVEFSSSGGDGALYMKECAKLKSGWVMSPEGFKVE